jgi:arylsulfatase A-like enzyme
MKEDTPMIRLPRQPLPGYLLFGALIVLAALGALAGIVASAPPGTAPTLDRRPNILIILSDDQGYHDAGFQGVQDIPTPNMDSIARHGVRCTNGYVTCSVCSPSRAGLLTGRYQTRFGHENLPPPMNVDDGLPLSEVTLASVLKIAGYRTGAIGKWHLGFGPQFHPNRRGFDQFTGFLDAQHDYFNYGGMDPIQHNGTPVANPDYLTSYFTSEAVRFLEQNDGRPFFLYLVDNAVHFPNQAPQSYLDRFPNINDPLRKGYAGKMSALDDGIGQVLDTLHRLGLEENTLVFYLTDNGGPLTQLEPNGANNYPLRGQKGQLYEGGIRVPFVVQWKGVLPENTVYEAPVISLDIFATAVAVANVPLPVDRVYDGVNLLPHLSGIAPDAPHDLLYWRQGGGQQYAVRDDRYKLVFQDGALQLYDLQNDMSETTDLAAQMPERVTQMTKAYQALNSQMVPPLWGPGHPGP